MFVCAPVMVSDRPETATNSASGRTTKDKSQLAKKKKFGTYRKVGAEFMVTIALFYGGLLQQLKKHSFARLLCFFGAVVLERGGPQTRSPPS